MTNIPENDLDKAAASKDFIRTRVDEDLASDKYGGRVATRFPPEPNGYLHIGHAKSICLNFGIAAEYEGATCNLRFDDTNPSKESQEYIDSILEDVRWLGFDWGENQFFASDYFEQLYLFAEKIIIDGKAYVDESSAEEIRAMRGTLTEPGKPSPHRDRSPDENLDLFRRMRAGEFADGSMVLRGKIDMASPNMTMRDPTLYRIRRVTHHRSGDDWCIYPMYDFTHCLSDSIERITHSLCTLEFENNRPLYDWVLEAADAPWRPQQTEFARLNLTYTIMSKRLLLQLVEEGLVSGWDDPRMPTISGLRRRGVPPEAIRAFCDRIGISKKESTVEVALFEHSIRDTLNTQVPRAMAVLDPLKVILTNYPEGEVEEIEAANFPDEPGRMGYRKIPFSKELYIERADFMEDPPKKFFRLAPGREVRLRWGYFIKCEEVIKDDSGKITALHCSWDPETKGGNAPDGRKVRGTIHWVSAAHAVDAEVRLVDRLFMSEKPGGENLKDDLNPDSLKVVQAKLERSLGKAEAGERFQFERQGYFCADPIDHADGRPVFNRTVPLRDSWAKIAKQQQNQPKKNKNRQKKKKKQAQEQT
ncbi:MAG: glutamine--tRNA ligase/YqeY domain fusion protein [Deltaproteobacteria bacterium]|nr:glutamine--tRNA ligase/YqeY domain fusion protein [Deltaproteobacteria bacterium]